MSQQDDPAQRIFDLMLDMQSFKKVVQSYIDKAVVRELQDIMNQGNFNDTVPAFLINKRIQQLKGGDK